MTTKWVRRIGVVTCGAEKLADYFPTLAEPDLVPTEPPFTPDDQLLVAELRRRGHQVAPVVWGTDVAQLRHRFDQLIIRSPWDYMDRDEWRAGFLQWLEQLSASGLVVDNPVPLMLWLMNKRYLLDFAAVGVPIVATRWVERGTTVDLAEQVRCQGATIIKPAVSAGGVGLELLSDMTAAERFQAEFTRRCERNSHLVQPLLAEIRTRGEWSLIFLGGQYSHAVHKMPGQGQIMVHAERGGSLRFAEPPLAVRQLGERVSSALPAAYGRRPAAGGEQPLYLRIDVIEGPTGAALSECEGVEPELFFRARPGSAARCADFVERSPPAPGQVSAGRP